MFNLLINNDLFNLLSINYLIIYLIDYLIDRYKFNFIN